MTDFRWYVVQSKPGQAEKAAHELQNQGFEVFLPQVRVEKLRRGKRVELEEPLFPGYLFIELSEVASNWRPIRSTRGVARMITFGDKPAVVPDDVVEQLRDNLRQRGELQSLKPNEPVRITEGPFANLNAVFAEYDGEKRAFLLLELLGQWQRLSLPLSAVKKID
ncbi:transcription/translation regulatory transformer protein RfaH [Marinobacterium sediminicola]|nr:transcription/translation regulatory transformer protein RfaH [Marinobacterium sediminicola]ULG68213.1 transcription/translation regulatory transformer protein RfaH [Marinobacterium sediminicola]